MKKILFISSILLLSISCEKEKTIKEGEVHLTGKVEGLKKGTLYIQKLVDTTFVIKDSIIFNGKEEFDVTVNIKEPQMLGIYLDRGQTESIDNSLQFFAEPGEMTLNSTLKEFFANAKVTGSKNQLKLDEFIEINNKFNAQNLELIAKDFKAKTEKEKQDLKIQSDKITVKKYLYAINFAKTNANMEVAPYILLKETPNAATQLLDTVQKALSPKVAKSLYGKQLKKLIEARK
jgi:hypothetical protein